jgi:hypothetical protein
MYSEDKLNRMASPNQDSQYDSRQPNFFQQQQKLSSIHYDDDKNSVNTATNHHTIDPNVMLHPEVRSEYSGIRGGGRGGPMTISHQNGPSTLVG